MKIVSKPKCKIYLQKPVVKQKLERILNDILESLKEKISQNEPKEVLLNIITSMQEQIGSSHIK